MHLGQACQRHECCDMVDRLPAAAVLVPRADTRREPSQLHMLLTHTLLFPPSSVCSPCLGCAAPRCRVWALLIPGSLRPFSWMVGKGGQSAARDRVTELVSAMPSTQRHGPEGNNGMVAVYARNIMRATLQSWARIRPLPPRLGGVAAERGWPRGRSGVRQLRWSTVPSRSPRAPPPCA